MKKDHFGAIMPAMSIKVGSLSLAYDDAGGGRPLLLIHGYPLHRGLWAPQISALSSLARVVAPDLPGHGESDVPPGPYSMDGFADTCLSLLDALGITEPVVLGGLSMGGYVAFAAWRRHPERIAGLILAATRAGADSPEARAGREASMTTITREGIRPIADAMTPRLLAPGADRARPELAATVHGMLASAPVSGALGALAGLRDRADSTSTLGTITVPTLVIHGAEDQLIPLAEAERTAAETPNATLVVIDGAGHLPNLEQPAAFNTAIEAYLNRL